MARVVLHVIWGLSPLEPAASPCDFTVVHLRRRFTIYTTDHRGFRLHKEPWCGPLTRNPLPSFSMVDGSLLDGWARTDPTSSQRIIIPEDMIDVKGLRDRVRPCSLQNPHASLACPLCYLSLRLIHNLWSFIRIFRCSLMYEHLHLMIRLFQGPMPLKCRKIIILLQRRVMIENYNFCS